MTSKVALARSQPPISARTRPGSCSGLAAFHARPHATFSRLRRSSTWGTRVRSVGESASGGGYRSSEIIDGNTLTNELAISAPMADHNGDEDANSGIVYVIAASGSLDLVNLHDPLTGVPGARVIAIRSMGDDDWFGFSISSAGNVIGNSTVDLLIGAPGGPRSGSAFPHTPTTAGSAYIIDGAALRAKFASSSFLLGTTLEMNLTQPLEAGSFVRLDGAAFYAPGPSEGARFGTSVCAIGNPDQAGRNTIAVGAIESWHNCTSNSFEFLSGQGPGFSNGRGRVFVFAPGSAANELSLVSMIGGAAVGDWFGYAVSGLSAVPGSPGGDADGDGFHDLLVGAPLHDVPEEPRPLTDAGAAYLYSGVWLENVPPQSVVAEFLGEYPGENAGWSLAGGGNMDGDGQAELAIGSRNYGVSNIPPDCCLQTLGMVGLFLRGGRVGRVRVFSGAHPTHVNLADIRGVQVRGHLGFSVCWLPPMEGIAGDYTELLMTSLAIGLCAGDPFYVPTDPLFCTTDDPRDEIGQGGVEFFKPGP
ncbi:MAG: hypothetical protein FJ299_03320 [Planctomycetes bacterium]|nr:hypothetical protein [Planctomycetota bacterium]